MSKRMISITNPVRERLRSGRESVREIIGRVALGISMWTAGKTLDQTSVDYAYWDRFRRGMVNGARLSGLFAQPAAEIKADWIMSEGFEAELATNERGENVEYTNTMLARFIARAKGLLLTMVTDLKAIGDQYVFINPDGSLSVPSPDTVKMEYDPLDYRRPIKCTITSKMDKFTITDEYRLDGRTITLKTMNQELFFRLVRDGWKALSNDTVVQEYENLIGRLPVVHFANNRSANEIHGRPQHEALLHLFERYDSIGEKGLEGAEIMSNPIPVFSGLDDVEETLDSNKEPVDETYYDNNGTQRSRSQISFDRFATILLYGDEKFELTSPLRGFTEDIKSMLKWLFLLILENLRIPEVIWGGELGQSRASAGEQMKTFYMHIAGQRLALEGMGADEDLGASAQGGLYELLDIWLRFRALVDPRVVVAGTRLKWPTLGEQNDEMTHKWAQSMFKDKVITKKTYAAMSGRVEDPQAEVDAADSELEAEQDQFDQDVDRAADEAAMDQEAAA